MNDNLLQLIVTALLSGGVVTAIFSYITKKSKSPESQNDLAKIGNDFAAQLLEDAREERKELRQTITDLEKSNDVKQSTIDRLNDLLLKKNAKIAELEQRQRDVLSKVQRGEVITLQDIFGPEVPGLAVTIDNPAL